MCGIAGYIGYEGQTGDAFVKRAGPLLKHRGPDDTGTYLGEGVAMLHMRLSILELSELGHQPMFSSCGRYAIVFNGEIYNHNELRARFLPNHQFRGHSDTETIIELFRLQQEKMLHEMVGMWAIAIWDMQTKRMFLSRDRYGQKPLYIRRVQSSWMFASEMKPLIATHEQPVCNATALVEYIALGNYGHLGTHTFFRDIMQFPQGSYAWVSNADEKMLSKTYWQLPDIAARDKTSFGKREQKQLHDLIVEGVLSQTLSDVPIGITLSGGIDSSIITGILSAYYKKDIHIFTAQSPSSKFDETRYVDAVIRKWNNPNFIVHNRNLNTLSAKDDLARYINIQEEPFGDPSIIAHGFLMQMAADVGIKVILNGQGADELFFGYNNMTQAVLLRQIKSMRLGSFFDNIKAMKLGQNFFLRTLLKSAVPDLEYKIRLKSRVKKREYIKHNLMDNVDDSMIRTYSYGNVYNVWAESIYGVHLPHLVHYDDRNGMAFSIEGRMPFLDHRIADFVATIRPEEFLKNGLRKYILRESCKEYLPDEVYRRTDKIGFYTPLADSFIRDKAWVAAKYQEVDFIDPAFHNTLANSIISGNLDTQNALLIWRQLSVSSWIKQFNVAYQG